jgi:hypothetical protein
MPQGFYGSLGSESLWVATNAFSTRGKFVLAGAILRFQRMDVAATS